MIAGHVGNLLYNLKHSFKALIPIFILIIFTLIGAVIFIAIEGPNEKYEMEQSKIKQEKLLEDTVFRLNTIKSMTPLQAYNHTVNTLIRYRNSLGVDEVNMNKTKWNIWGAIYYSMTIYTTIGYGNITPETTTGRVLTIIYAFIGIPLTLITLIALGSLFAKLCLYAWKLIARSMGCFSKNLERKLTQLGTEEALSTTETEAETETEELLQFPVGFLIGLTIFWIFFCAFIFLLWEDSWNYGLSLYFVLISFTTIGFGDVFPSKSNYMILVGLMLLIGLSLVSTVLTIIQKQIHALADDMKGRIDKDYQAALGEAATTDGSIRENSIEPVENGIMNAEKNKKEAKGGLNDVISRMPLRSRILYQVMPSDRRKQLIKHVKKRQNITTKWVQTDPVVFEDHLNIDPHPDI